MRVVADAGPLIHLSWIDQLHILRELYEQTFAPRAVLNEIMKAPGARGVPGLQRAFASGLVVVRNVASLASPPGSVSSQLGAGESEAIRLVKELNVGLLLSDDALARSEAERQGIKSVGTIGLLTRARDRGL